MLKGLKLRHAVVGCLLGGAVGDALGLPREGLSPARARRLFQQPDRHRLLFGRGMYSDDTEHACLVGLALLRSCGDPELFELDLARRLRRWLLCLPAGAGFATLRACVKLCVGFGPSRSGVDSPDNGAVTRSALLGVLFGHDRVLLRDYVRRSTRITHRNDRAYQGALVVAVAAYVGASEYRVSGHLLLSQLRSVLDGRDSYHFVTLIEEAIDSARTHERVSNLALRLGSHHGISDNVEHTVPCVIQVWLRYPDDYSAALQEIIGAGGDTDTTAAILGALIGARQGKQSIPGPWLRGLADWPRDLRWVEHLAERVAEGRYSAQLQPEPSYHGSMLLMRNLVFLLVVLFHGFRRMLPPY